MLLPSVGFLLLGWHLVLMQAPAVYTIYGTVCLPDGSPASGIIVSISSQAGCNLQVTTDNLGRYEIPGLPRGRYYLTATNPSEPGQSSDSVEVDAPHGAAGRILVKFILRSDARFKSMRGTQTVSVTVTEASQRVPGPAEKAYKEGQRYSAKKRYSEALASYSNSIGIFPAYFQALGARGHLRIVMGQASEAEKDFTQALELNGSYEPALRGLGICRFQEGRFEEAAELFVRAASESPGNALNHLFLGISYSELGRSAAARVSLEKALAVDPVGAVRAHVHLAGLWIRDDRPQEAIAELEAYLSAAPGTPDAETLHATLNQLRQRVPKR
jgi:tetratricopeptide (TPR) repeat protein